MRREDMIDEESVEGGNGLLNIQDDSSSNNGRGLDLDLVE
jgi:hypothetical protein